MTEKTIEALKEEIDSMSQEELCYKWRYEPIGSLYFRGELSEYFESALERAGGFTPEISKSLGWKDDS